MGPCCVNLTQKKEDFAPGLQWGTVRGREIEFEVALGRRIFLHWKLKYGNPFSWPDFHQPIKIRDVVTWPKQTQSPQKIRSPQPFYCPWPFPKQHFAWHYCFRERKCCSHSPIWSDLCTIDISANIWPIEPSTNIWLSPNCQGNFRPLLTLTLFQYF